MNTEEPANYDIRVAAQGYSNIATVLSGFAFAAVVLVIQTPEDLPELQYLLDWTIIGFMIAFFGCILSALTFAVVSGESNLSQRSHTMGLLVASGFAISTSFIIWAIVNMSKIYLSEHVTTYIAQIMPLFIGIGPSFLAFSALDPILGFDHRDPTPREYLTVFLPAYIPFVVIFGLMWWNIINYSIEFVSGVFNYFSAVSILVILISNLWTLWVSMQPPDSRLNLKTAGVVIFATSSIIAFMILLV